MMTQLFFVKNLTPLSEVLSIMYSCSSQFLEEENLLSSQQTKRIWILQIFCHCVVQ